MDDKYWDSLVGKTIQYLMGGRTMYGKVNEVCMEERYGIVYLNVDGKWISESMVIGVTQDLHEK